MTLDFNLYCDRGYLKELCEFLLMAIASIMTIGLSAFQDLFGRRRLLLLSFILAVSGFMCVSSGTSLVVCLIGLILLWSYVEVSYIILIVLSNELIANPVRKYVHNCFSIVLCFGGVFGNFLTHYLTSYQALKTVIFFLLPAWISVDDLFNSGVPEFPTQAA